MCFEAAADSEDSKRIACGWCKSKLTAGERFEYEMEVATFEYGGLFPDGHPAMQWAGEPTPTCETGRPTDLRKSDFLNSSHRLQSPRLLPSVPSISLRA